jgi:segregation and condensation protein A
MASDDTNRTPEFPTGSGHSYEIKLDIFEGPLDLLLFLVRKNEIDIYNIPIATITDQYLQYLEVMKSLNLDIAGEYLVMASTLILMKSRMLLPPDEEEPPAEAPIDLSKMLLEYQEIKNQALTLSERPLLGRDVFKREAVPDESEGQEEESFVELGIFDLIEAFRKVISGMRKEDIMAIDLERLSLTDRINEIMERLQAEKNLTFEDLLENAKSRRRIIYTLLAILELMKLKAIRAFQVDPFGTIRIFLAVDEKAADSEALSGGDVPS